MFDTPKRWHIIWYSGNQQKESGKEGEEQQPTSIIFSRMLMQTIPLKCGGSWKTGRNGEDLWSMLGGPRADLGEVRFKFFKEKF